MTSSMIDLTSSKAVDLRVDNTGKLWLNIDGHCVVRIGHIESLSLDIQRRAKKPIWSTNTYGPTSV